MKKLKKCKWMLKEEAERINGEKKVAYWRTTAHSNLRKKQREISNSLISHWSYSDIGYSDGPVLGPASTDGEAKAVSLPLELDEGRLLHGPAVHFVRWCFKLYLQVDDITRVDEEGVGLILVEMVCSRAVDAANVVTNLESSAPLRWGKQE